MPNSSQKKASEETIDEGEKLSHLIQVMAKTRDPMCADTIVDSIIVCGKKIDLAKKEKNWDSEYRSRELLANAMTALSLLGDRRVVPYVMGLIRQEDYLSALPEIIRRNYSEEIWKELSASLFSTHDAPKEITTELAGIMAGLRKPNSAHELIPKMMFDPRWVGSEYNAQALRALPPAELVHALAHSSSLNGARIAAQALASCYQDVRLLPQLRRLAESKDPVPVYIRAFALRLIGIHGGADEHAYLQGRFDFESIPELRAAAWSAYALTDLKLAENATLLLLNNSPDAEIRQAAAKILALADHKDSPQALIKALQHDESSLVRSSAVCAMLRWVATTQHFQGYELKVTGELELINTSSHRLPVFALYVGTQSHAGVFAALLTAFEQEKSLEVQYAIIDVLKYIAETSGEPGVMARFVLADALKKNSDPQKEKTLIAAIFCHVLVTKENIEYWIEFTGKKSKKKISLAAR